MPTYPQGVFGPMKATVNRPTPTTTRSTRSMTPSLRGNLLDPMAHTLSDKCHRIRHGARWPTGSEQRSQSAAAAPLVLCTRVHGARILNALDAAAARL